MTRKDFELIAGILSNSAQSHALNPFTGECLFGELVRDFADALQATNPRFDRARFIKACEVN
jgi:hypothetical protein